MCVFFFFFFFYQKSQISEIFPKCVLDIKIIKTVLHLDEPVRVGE